MIPRRRTTSEARTTLRFDPHPFSCDLRGFAGQRRGRRSTQGHWLLRRVDEIRGRRHPRRPAHPRQLRLRRHPRREVRDQRQVRGGREIRRARRAEEEAPAVANPYLRRRLDRLRAVLRRRGAG